MENKEKDLQSLRIKTDADALKLNELMSVKDRQISQMRVSYETDSSALKKRNDEEILQNISHKKNCEMLIKVTFYLSIKTQKVGSMKNKNQNILNTKQHFFYQAT